MPDISWISDVGQTLSGLIADLVTYLVSNVEKVIALGAFAWAVYQFRWSSGKADVLDKMMAQAKLSQPFRTVISKEYPQLLLFGRESVCGVPELDLRLEAEKARWETLGTSYTAAHEILSSELKFRSLLWAIGCVRDQESPTWEGVPQWEKLNKNAKDCVRYMNDFGSYYETGVYPRHVVMGQLHAAIAVPAKALEPLIWSNAAEKTRSRWGRRIVRMGLEAQGYNDRTRKQQVSPMIWTSRGLVLMIHPSLASLVSPKGSDWSGQTVKIWTSRRQRRMHGIPRNRAALWFSTTFAYWSRLLNRAYGGRRLRLHNDYEDALVVLLRRAQELAGLTGKEAQQEERNEAGRKLVSFALDSRWSLDVQRREISEATHVVAGLAVASGE